MEQTNNLNTLFEDYMENHEHDYHASSLLHEALKYSKEETLDESEDAIGKLTAYTIETAWKDGFKEALRLMAELNTLAQYKQDSKQS